jgi:hypothetical protein
MTKKDYIALASCLRATKPLETDHNAYSLWERIGREIAGVLEAENTRFNRKKWLEYIHTPVEGFGIWREGHE